MSNKAKVEIVDSVNEVFSIISSNAKLILADTNTIPLLGSDTFKNIPKIVIPPGENSKSLNIASQVWEKMLELNLNKNDCLICFGGGVITDLGAFCATTFKRGIKYIHIPTSLLAMVDAALGGKNGINFKNFKNYIGSFSSAERVIIYPSFLKSLSKEELRSGYGEIVKHALLEGGNLFQTVSESISTEIPSIDLIKDASQVKLEIVEQDFEEKDLRKLLNLGHTIGHALESDAIINNHKITHGDAVAAGLICETYISALQNKADKKTLELVVGLVTSMFPKIRFTPDQFQQIIKFCKGDKKGEDASINCTLLHRVGDAEINCLVTEIEIIESLNYYSQNVKE